jgi:hypothetical protein
MDALGAFLTLSAQGAYNSGPTEFLPRKKAGTGMTFNVVSNGGPLK